MLPWMKSLLLPTSDFMVREKVQCQHLNYLACSLPLKSFSSLYQRILVLQCLQNLRDEPRITVPLMHLQNLLAIGLLTRMPFQVRDFPL